MAAPNEPVWSRQLIKGPFGVINIDMIGRGGTLTICMLNSSQCDSVHDIAGYLYLSKSSSKNAPFPPLPSLAFLGLISAPRASYFSLCSHQRHCASRAYA